MVEKIAVSELLLKKSVVGEGQIKKAAKEAEKAGVTLEKALDKLGIISEEEIAKLRAEELGVSYLDLEDYRVDSRIIGLVPENLARKYQAVPLFKIGGSLTVAMANPQDIIALDRIREASKAESIEPVLAAETGIQKVLDFYHKTGSLIDSILSTLKENDPGKEPAGVERAQEAPIIQLVSAIIAQAAKKRASDIHIEPEESMVRVRYRIDGILFQEKELPKKIQNLVVSRIKILAEMDIAENRKPQDGRIRMKLENTELDLRVSTFPTVNGENLTLRLLDKSSLIIGLEKLGFEKNIESNFKKLIQRPHGIILVTGPTGSGKTTTLYSALTAINSLEKNIITIEDPVEYRLPLIRQSAVNPKAGLNFANGLRNILRQDPDIIMVGEIRDRETAGIAIQAALTGHLVFSTLHTNDAASALTRLADMGVEPFLIASSVIGILAQRLVRTLCRRCKEEYVPSQEVLKEFGIKKKKLHQSKGCSSCNYSGFAGRIGLFELIVVDETIKEMVAEKKAAATIKKKALKLQKETLRGDGIRKVETGITTLDEVLRVTGAG